MLSSSANARETGFWDRFYYHVGLTNAALALDAG